MDANPGEPWSEADISDLKNELDHGRTIAEIASFLCRDEDEVRAKMKELRLTEQPAKRRVLLRGGPPSFAAGGPMPDPLSGC
jgi:hypothetical protein